MFLYNFSWTFLDRIVKIISSMLVGVIFTRYLGPIKFGEYSFVISWVSIFSTIALVGSEHISIKYLSKFTVFSILKSYHKLKKILFYSGLICFLISVTLAKIIFDEKPEFIAVSIASISLMFQYYYTSSFLLQAKEKFSLLGKINIIQSLFSITIKVLLIYFKVSLDFFYLSFALDGLIFLIIYRLLISSHEFHSTGSNIISFKNLIKESYPLLLSGLLLTIYLKVDQFLIKGILGNKDLGIFTVVIRLTEASVIVPYAYLQVFMPKIFNKTNKSDQFLYDSVIIMAFFIAGIVTLFSQQIINIFFGEAFIEAILPLRICIWSIVFLTFGQLNFYFSVSDNDTKTILKKVIVGLLFNLITCYFLTTHFGIVGTAISTLVSYFFSALFLVFFFPNQRWQIKYFFRTLNFVKSFKRVYLVSYKIYKNEL